MHIGVRIRPRPCIVSGSSRCDDSRSPLRAAQEDSKQSVDSSRYHGTPALASVLLLDFRERQRRCSELSSAPRTASAPILLLAQVWVGEATHLGALSCCSITPLATFRCCNNAVDWESIASVGTTAIYTRFIIPALFVHTCPDIYL